MTDSVMPASRGFKRKTIVKNINDKIDEWLKTINVDEDEPQKFRDEIKDNLILTGGAIASMLRGELPNDYDFYFKKVEIAEKVARYYLKSLIKDDKVRDIDVIKEKDDDGISRLRVMIKSAGVAFSGDENFNGYDYFESCPKEVIDKYLDKNRKYIPYAPMNITTNCITLYDGVQLVIRFIGSPKMIHQTYDFVHATNYWTQETGLVLNQDALEAILSKELKYVGSRYPICSMFRLKKFIKRGWSITAGEMLKIAYDISNLDLNDLNILQDQLVGVDAAYFLEIINLLKDKESIDRTYLHELINRVFDEGD